MLLGLAGGTAFCAYGARRDREREIALYAWALVAAALMYVFFAIDNANTRWVGIELTGVALFGLCAYLGCRTFPYLIAIGWLTHPLWDVWLHLVGPGHGIPPTWYAIACISFDIVVGGFCAWRIYRV